MSDILFIGNFLSKKRGTINPSELISKALQSEGIKTTTASSRVNTFLRLLEIIVKAIFTSYSTIHIDVFSGRSFYIAEVASYIGKIRNKNIILTLHGGMLPEFYNKHPKRSKNIFERANSVLSPSLFLCDFYKSKSLEVKHLPNPIQLEKFQFQKKSFQSSSLLWVRAFHPIYNPDIAVLCLFLLKKEFPTATLTMIGPDKGIQQQIEKKIRDLNLEDSVNILGPIPNEELYQYYHTHDVFLNTTSHESFGQAVMEAASCGIPVVSSSVGEIPYIWENGYDIMLVDEIDSKKFAEQVSQLLNSKSVSEKVSTNARNKAVSYSWEVLKPQFISILHRQ